MRQVELPSGATLDIKVAPWAKAEALYMAILGELKGLSMDQEREVGSMIKDMLLASLSSQKVKAALKECMERSLYNGLKITDDIFEPVEARKDYVMCCILIAQDTLEPFFSGLFAGLSQLTTVVEKLGQQ